MPQPLALLVEDSELRGRESFLTGLIVPLFRFCGTGEVGHDDDLAGEVSFLCRRRSDMAAVGGEEVVNAVWSISLAGVASCCMCFKAWAWVYSFLCCGDS